MVRKVRDGYVVVSKVTGRRLSKLYKSKEEAEARLREIEYFKHTRKGKK